MEKNTAKILEAIQEIAKDKDIDSEEIIQGIKDGFKKAFERFFDPEAITEVDVDLQTGQITMHQLLKVIDKMTEDSDDWLEIGLDEARKEFGDNVAVGDIVRKNIEFDEDFSRSAVHQVRQIIQQNIRSTERGKIYDKFIQHEHDLLSGKISGMNEQQTAYLVDVDGAVAYLWSKRMIPGDKFKIGDIVPFYVESVERDSKYSQINASRTAPGFLAKILEREVPEIADGIIEVKAVSRQPGERAKVAVISNDPNVEPIGSIVGVRGSRINKVSEQLNGEKIDVVLWDDNINQLIMNAMAPVRVVSVEYDEENNEADVIVPNEQLSLAIGKSGLAARLVANLLKIKINILSVNQAEELGVENRWNGNITLTELESKDFLDATNRRRNHIGPSSHNGGFLRDRNSRDNTNSYDRPTNQPRRNSRQNWQQNSEDALKELEKELERFQSEIEKENHYNEVVLDDQIPPVSPSEKVREDKKPIEEQQIDTEELVKTEGNLEEIEENLKAFNQVIEDENDDDDFEDNDDSFDDDFDEYYDK